MPFSTKLVANCADVPHDVFAFVDLSRTCSVTYGARANTFQRHHSTLIRSKLPGQDAGGSRDGTENATHHFFACRLNTFKRIVNFCEDVVVVMSVMRLIEPVVHRPCVRHNDAKLPRATEVTGDAADCYKSSISTLL
jgi:hypothetical protein